MRSRLRSRDEGSDPEAKRLVVLVGVALFLGLAASLILLGYVPSSPGPLTGTWTGRDASGRETFYHFGDDELGYRVVDGSREEFGYTLIEGYPNELSIRMPSGADTAVYRGLVDFWKAGQLRLEFAGHGDPPPERITVGALALRRVPTR